MVKNVADDNKMPVASISDGSLQTRFLPKQLAVVGKGMRRNNVLLPNVLQADVQRWYPWSGLQYSLSKQASSLLSQLPLSPLIPQSLGTSSKTLPEAFIGWGHKKSYQRATKAANRQQMASLSIEDGFLRSLDSGISSRYGLSVVVDDIGIYFDLTKRSRLEQLIIERTQKTVDTELFAVENVRAQQLMADICNAQLSKYNAVTDCPSLDQLVADRNTKSLKNTSKTHILLIDQVAGDASITGAGADKRQFKKMLKAACRNHPDGIIWIKG